MIGQIDRSSWVLAGGAVAAIACRVQRLDHVPHGTGDLLSALLAGHTLRLGAQQVVFSEQVLARAVAGVDLVVRASMAHDELCLVAQLGNLATCAPLPLVAVD